jgi:hypothetical protein
MIAMIARLAVIAFMVAPVSSGCGRDVPETKFKIVTKDGNDRVEVGDEDGKAIISIRSPFGISEANIERTEEKWTDNVVLRLHLKGLENFKVTNDNVTLEATVSSQDGKVRQWKDGEDGSLIDVDSPYWMEFRLLGRDGKPVTAIPLNDGFFELQFPNALFDGNPRSITVSWIDFYR